MIKSNIEHKILVYHLGAIGDTVVTIPALKAIRRNFGDQSKIVMLHETRCSKVQTPVAVLLTNYCVDRFLSYPYYSYGGAKFAAAYRLLLALKRERFRTVVYLAPSQRSAGSVYRDELFFKLCGIPNRIGFHAFSPHCLCPVDDKGRLQRVQQEALWKLDRLRLSGINVTLEYDLSPPFLDLPAVARDEASNWLERNGVPQQRPLVAICPGSKQAAKLWPLTRFRDVGSKLLNLSLFELLVVGGPSDRHSGEYLLESWRSGFNAAGSLSVLGSAALLSRCSFVIGLDTGTTHLAAALGIPCVAIYSCIENPGRWEPMGQGHRVLRSHVDCAGCRMETCSVPTHPCMNMITVNTVWDEITQLEVMKTLVG